MYNKINGFHIGIPSNSTGIDDYLQNLANLNIPFSTKAVRNSSGLIKAQSLIKSGSIGYAIWRLDLFNDSNNDVPRYGSDINSEADRIWNTVLQKFPPELDKNIIWIELINEPNKNWADWLGYLATALGERALRDGYKIACFGWSSGEPELEDWLTDGMQSYLNLVKQHPDQLAVSVHEYSYDKSNIKNGNGWLIGRIEKVFETVGEFTTFITEWGWEYRDVPDVDQAMSDIISVGEIYAKYPSIKGCQIWALDLGKNWDDLGNKVNKFMTPLVDTLKHTYPNPETFDEFLIRVAEQNRTTNFNSKAAIEGRIIADDMVVTGNETWTVFNGIQYAVQPSQRLGSDPAYCRAYWCEVPNWDDINYEVYSD